MRKKKEINDPKSCLNRALPDELIMTFLGRDAATPHAIREWAKKRIELGLNRDGEEQIREALDMAHNMEVEYPLVRKQLEVIAAADADSRSKERW